jgi:hypothetical protein
MSITTQKEESQLRIEDYISKAMKKVGVTAPNQLCKFIPYEGGHLHHFTMDKLKKKNQERLEEMLKTYIFDKNAPKPFPPKNRKPYKRKSSAQQTQKPIDRHSLEGCIALAMRRKSLKLKKENDLCRYLSTQDGKRLHFRAFKKIKKEDPEVLKSLIEKHLLDPKKPQIVPIGKMQYETKHPQQKLLNSPSKENLLHYLEQFVHILKNEKIYLSEKQEPSMNLLQRSLKIVQNQLIQLIQNKGIDPELWETYVLLVKEMY